MTNKLALVSTVLAGCLAPFAASGGSPVLYHSSDPGGAPEPPKLMGTSSSEQFTLWIDAGSSPSTGTVCENGDGDELCGIDVLVSIPSGQSGRIVAFDDGPGLQISHFPEEPIPPSTQLRLVLLQAVAPPAAGPQQLGTVTIDNSLGPPALTVRARGQIVSAAGKLVNVPEQEVAGGDADFDGVNDLIDRCLGVANPADASGEQLDTDGDGCGNPCDVDYDNDGFVGGPDFNRFRLVFGLTGADPGFNPAVDSDGDGVVGGPDFNLFRTRFGGAVGPAGPAVSVAGFTACVKD